MNEGAIRTNEVRALQSRGDKANHKGPRTPAGLVPGQQEGCRAVSGSENERQEVSEAVRGNILGDLAAMITFKFQAKCEGKPW